MKSELDQILRARAIESVYQPIVDLATRRVRGYEALARGPKGSPLERPDLLFLVAREAGRLQELDWECRGAAIRGALRAGLGPPLTLFANVEPDALTAPVPAHIQPMVEQAMRVPIVVEVTERAIGDQPAGLLAAMAAVRSRGWGVAVDDVGADARSLALMPFLRPDVIKLDLRLVRDRPNPEIAGVVSAVNAHAERTGATILAEGIETEEQLATALSFGATLGQGWLLGRPGPLPDVLDLEVDPIPLIPPLGSELPATPFEVVAGSRGTRVGGRGLLSALSDRMEEQALQLPELPLLISSFQHIERFARVASRYAALAARLPFVGAIAQGMATEPARRVRGASLSPGEALSEIWSVHVIGPHFAAAMVAREMAEVSGAEPTFEFALTHDRDLVIRAAQVLLQRIVSL